MSVYTFLDSMLDSDPFLGIACYCERIPGTLSRQYFRLLLEASGVPPHPASGPSPPIGGEGVRIESCFPPRPHRGEGLR